MKTPDITKAQLLAVVQAVIGLVVAFGAPISDEQTQAIIQLCTALAVTLPLADAHVRNGRAQNAMAISSGKAVEIHDTTIEHRVRQLSKSIGEEVVLEVNGNGGNISLKNGDPVGTSWTRRRALREVGLCLQIQGNDHYVEIGNTWRTR
jgi:hypothetical protein